MLISGGMRCSHRYAFALVQARHSARECWAAVLLQGKGADQIVFNFHVQNLQQSRSFGNNFKFPESTAGVPAQGGAAAPAGNAGFGEDAQDDDLYA